MAVLTDVQREAKWKAEEDARILITAKEINSDPVRLRLAKKEASIMLKQKEAEIKAFRSLAKQS